MPEYNNLSKAQRAELWKWHNKELAAGCDVPGVSKPGGGKQSAAFLATWNAGGQATCSQEQIVVAAVAKHMQKNEQVQREQAK